ncbi:hypothetical protein ES708_01511 [subsurface metagenome]
MRKKQTKPPAEIVNTDIRVRCVIGHEIPLGSGHFIRYEAGEICMFPEGDYDTKFFTPVKKTGAEKSKETEVKDDAG